jgi:hypothetical protein
MDIVERLREYTPDATGKSYAWGKAMKDAADEIERLRSALAFIAGQEQYTFAECSLAEQIIGRAKAALER